MKITLVCLALCIILPFADASDAVSFERVLDHLTQPIIKLKNKEPTIVDEVQYRPASKEYRVRTGKVVITHNASQVDYCIAPKPQRFDKMNDIESLENIIREYDHLWWDQQAAQSLITLYNAENKHRDAVTLYRKMSDRAGTKPVSTQMRLAYWSALEGSRQYDALDRDLKDAAAGNDRQLSAYAFIARGDMLSAKGEVKKALAEGYLKTVAMFGDVTEAKYIALKKAMELMEKVGDSRVDRLHKMFNADFGHLKETNKTPAS